MKSTFQLAAQSAVDLYTSGQFQASRAAVDQLLASDLSTLTDVEQCKLYNTYCLLLLYTANHTRCHDVVEATYNTYHYILHHSHSCLHTTQFSQHNSCTHDTRQCSLHCSANAWVVKQQRYKLRNANSHHTPPKTLTCHNTTVYDRCALYAVLCELVLLKILLNHIHPNSTNRGVTFDWLSIPEHWSLQLRRKLKVSTVQLYRYYLIIHRLPFYELKLAVNMEQHADILHMVGDSHILTLANRQLQLGQVPHHAKSYLIPGCKAYHIATCSSAHTTQRSVYLHHITSVPLHARCMIVAGEIDCRRSEGILIAVNSGKFNSLDEALCTTVHAYVRQLLQAAEQRQMRAWYVHPVRPPYIGPRKVRNAVRYQQRKHGERTGTSEVANNLELVYNVALLIRDWNKQLQHEIASQQAHMQPDKRVVHYIDIYDQMRDTDANASKHTALQYLLREVYTLEGLHLNTQYVPMLEAAISKVHTDSS